MKTHLSQPVGDGVFDGQHGMPAVIMSVIAPSFAISSIINGADISSAIACIDAPEDISAITGRDNGANARPAIIRIASSRPIMVTWRFTSLKSHRSLLMKSL